VKVRYIGETDPSFVISGHEYEATQIDAETLLVFDEANQHYPYPAELFRILLSEK